MKLYEHDTDIERINQVLISHGITPDDVNTKMAQLTQQHVEESASAAQQAAAEAKELARRGVLHREAAARRQAEASGLRYSVSR